MVLPEVVGYIQMICTSTGTYPYTTTAREKRVSFALLLKGPELLLVDYLFAPYPPRQNAAVIVDTNRLSRKRWDRKTQKDDNQLILNKFK